MGSRSNDPSDWAAISWSASSGAIIARWLFPSLGIDLGGGIGGAIIAPAIGAIILLVIAKLGKQPPRLEGSPSERPAACPVLSRIGPTS
jgi:hypothetical protein